MTLSISYILEMIQLSILFVFEQLRRITVPNPEKYTPQIESNKIATPLTLPTPDTSIDEGVINQDSFVNTIILYACIVVVFSIGLVSVLKREPHRVAEMELRVQLHSVNSAVNSDVFTFIISGTNTRTINQNSNI